MQGTLRDVTHEVVKHVELLEGEVFRTIEDFPHYYISNMARVFTTHRNRLLKVQNSGWGYIHVSLIGNDGKAYHKRLHRLVAIAFLDNPKDLPDVHHRDRNRKNNLLSNLEWIATKRNTELGKGTPVYLINMETGKQRKYITVNIGGEEKTLNYRKSLPLEDYAKLVTGVAYQVVNDESGYNPFVYDVALKKGVIESFSDFKIPNDLNGFYDSGEMDVIYTALVDKVSINDTIADIDKLIDFKKTQLANKSEIDNLCRTATEVLLRFEKKFGNQINPQRQLTPQWRS